MHRSQLMESFSGAPNPHTASMACKRSGLLPHMSVKHSNRTRIMTISMVSYVSLEALNVLYENANASQIRQKCPVSRPGQTASHSQRMDPLKTLHEPFMPGLLVEDGPRRIGPLLKDLLFYFELMLARFPQFFIRPVLLLASFHIMPILLKNRESDQK